MIVLIDLLHLRIERSTRYKPHDEFRSLVARALHVIPKRNLGEGDWIIDETFQELPIERGLHEARTLSLKLVRHAARTHNEYASILWICIHRLADGLTKLEAPGRLWQRELNGVDCDRDDLGRPLFNFAGWAAEHD